MTDTAPENTTEAPDPDADESTDATSTPPAGEQEAPEEDPRGNNEAAKYRRQLRDTETERDALRTQLAQLRDTALDMVVSQRVEFPSERGDYMRGATLKNGADLFALGGITREQAWKPDGTIDHDRISAAVAGLHATRPELFERFGPIIPTMGTVPEPKTSTAGAWVAAFEDPSRSPDLR